MGLVCAGTCRGDDDMAVEETESVGLRSSFRRSTATVHLPSLLATDADSGKDHGISMSNTQTFLENLDCVGGIESALEERDFERLHEAFIARQKEAFSRGGTTTPEDAAKLPAFVNTMLEHMWPVISDFTTKMIGDVIEPAIKRALGSLGGNFGFDLAQCHLGNKPAHFSDIAINKATQLTEDGQLDNIVMRGSLTWEGDISIVTRFGALPLGIRGVKLQGTLVLECVGMMSRPPFFQGVRVFFINPPNVDLDFQGRLTSVLEFRAIRRQALEVCAEQISRKLVVPNRMGVQLDRSADFFRVMKPRPRGILKLGVMCAEGLLAMDRSMVTAKPSSSDPYVIVRCGAECFRSQTVKKSLAPTFNFEVRLPIASVRHQRVQVELWDSDFGKKDDFLGALDLQVADLIALSVARGQMWMDLADQEGNAHGRGRALIAAEWRPLLLDLPDHPPDESGWVFAGVYGAAQLPGRAPGTTFWVTASCSNLLPGRNTEGVLSTIPLERQAPTDTDCVEEEASRARIERKLAILRKHKLPVEDMAEVLEIDAATLRRQAPTRELQAMGRHTIRWNHAFEFLIASAREAVIKFELRCKSPGEQEKVLGTITYPIIQLLLCPHSTSVQALPVSGTEITLKVRMQMRMLGEPESLPHN
mmetsp:Transcript_127762/g.319022  ORF Transcript_127762/g.319022 Transcript_127762/m.319022 type:complete len:646 (-) Transcript_127762:229-2166(-)